MKSNSGVPGDLGFGFPLGETVLSKTKREVWMDQSSRINEINPLAI
jgi:hypothetical protein